jgi:hypothetical protein
MLRRFIAYENPKIVSKCVWLWGAVLMMMWRSVVARLTVALVDK